ncbi:MAG: SoxR reducing system RseC family protein [Bacteroidota bacterium]
MSKNLIEHKGRIENIEGNKIKVRFTAISACAACHAKGVCTASDMENKEVEVIAEPANYHIGEQVNVVLQQSLGFKALLYGYVLPFFLLLIALIIFSITFNNELIAGIGAIGVLIPYYIMLYFYNDRFKKVFSFKIQKLS